MASATTNLHLKLLGTSLADKEMTFEEWRQHINGEAQNSNMQIIDAAIKSLDDTKVGASDVITNAQIDALFDDDNE